MGGISLTGKIKLPNSCGSATRGRLSLVLWADIERQWEVQRDENECRFSIYRQIHL